ncbi:MAG: EpsI family protein [Sterolibacteriaceae bacterium]|uniref:EpsI family protein n=1 Tax=Candidatus Methylophosphatis roskildensis TaxID=2899263 RepID=A0A9D7E1K0_9PROT|nr:EpsI family protein [Candidatus Methylophosphatis roskildensis]MBK7237459.1 EpsI family protein [Sterolibacteriaceae bacterium]
MLSASIGAVMFEPDLRQVSQREPLGLDALVPKSFSDWHVDESVIPVLPSPELEEKMNRTYDETLARTYINRAGSRVMLSIAYGGDQTGRLRVHRPESCYSAQGFLVTKIAETRIPVGKTMVPAKRLVAQAGARQEPITYWIRIGDEAVTSLFGQRIAQLKRGLTGEVPEGLIFRVSSLGVQRDVEYALHDRFIAELLNALPIDQQSKLIGRAATP